jgi:hypothetical protein
MLDDGILYSQSRENAKSDSVTSCGTFIEFLYILFPWVATLLEILQLVIWPIYSMSYMKLQGSLPYLQELVSVRNPEID